eukprot:7362040-Alexandrium_andersonii.AAC.6
MVLALPRWPGKRLRLQASRAAGGSPMQQGHKVEARTVGPLARRAARRQGPGASACPHSSAPGLEALVQASAGSASHIIGWKINSEGTCALANAAAPWDAPSSVIQCTRATWLQRGASSSMAEVW